MEGNVMGIPIELGCPCAVLGCRRVVDGRNQICVIPWNGSLILSNSHHPHTATLDCSLIGGSDVATIIGPICFCQELGIVSF